MSLTLSPVLSFITLLLLFPVILKHLWVMIHIMLSLDPRITCNRSQNAQNRSLQASFFEIEMRIRFLDYFSLGAVMGVCAGRAEIRDFYEVVKHLLLWLLYERTVRGWLLLLIEGGYRAEIWLICLQE